MTASPDSNVILQVADNVGRITLNRADRHNAFDDSVIAELADIFDEVASDPKVRVVILAANGKSFSAGADLGWMKRTAAYSVADNEADALVLADMLSKLDALPKPTIALVQGGAYGGGVGLVAACDMAVAADNAVFCLSEVKLGLIPSVISPYVLAAMGSRAARRYFFTAEAFDAAEAHRLGLIHEVVPADDLAAAGDRLTAYLLAAGPEALAEAKQLIAHVAGRPIDTDLKMETAHRIAGARARAEGQEGIAAFLERRKPGWQTD
jgi:methylglutaconyl-CoA hydratase